MGFFKTLFTGYRILWNDINRKHNDLIPRCLSGCGSGLMMIGSAVMAKTGMQEDVQQVIAEANAAVDEAKAIREGEKKSERTKRIFKAKTSKGWKIVKVFRKGAAMEVGGALLNGAGYLMAEKGKHNALKAVGTVGAAFAAYRANVRDDLGDEADLRYLTGRKVVKKTEKIDRKTGEVTHELEYIQDDDGITIQKDPDAFKLWFSEETCPDIWTANFDLRMHKLQCIEDILTLKLQTSKHISLNEMRREFGGMNPAKMDVGIGGIFGRVVDPKKPLMQQTVNLHFRDDKDFCEGRTDGCWIIFDCDPDPIIDKVNKKMKQVEK